MAQIILDLPQGSYKVESNDVLNIGSSYHPLFLLQRPDGSVIGLVFAEHEQEALDELVNANKLDTYVVANEDLPRVVTGESGDETLDDVPLTRLGNAGELFDISEFTHECLFKVELSKFTRFLIENAFQA